LGLTGKWIWVAKSRKLPPFFHGIFCSKTSEDARVWQNYSLHEYQRICHIHPEIQRDDPEFDAAPGA